MSNHCILVVRFLSLLLFHLSALPFCVLVWGFRAHKLTYIYFLFCLDKLRSSLSVSDSWKYSPLLLVYVSPTVEELWVSTNAPSRVKSLGCCLATNLHFMSDFYTCVQFQNDRKNKQNKISASLINIKIMSLKVTFISVSCLYCNILQLSIFLVPWQKLVSTLVSGLAAGTSSSLDIDLL